MAGKTASAWNNAGTWEERDVSKWAGDDLKSRFEAVRTESDGVVARVEKVNTCSGEALITFPRGIKRAGYEFEDVKLDLEVTLGSDNVKVGVVLPYVCDDVDDHEYEVRYTVRGTDSATEKKVRSYLGQLVTPALRNVIRQFSEQLLLQ